MLLNTMTCIRLDVAIYISVYLSAPSWDFFFFVCSILRRIETALENIEEDLAVDLQLSVNFSVWSRSALLNSLDHSDKTFSFICLVIYLVHFRKLFRDASWKSIPIPLKQTTLVCGISSVAGEHFGCQEYSSSFQSEPACFPSGFLLFYSTSKVGGSASAPLPVCKGYWHCIKEHSDVDLSSYSLWQF